MKDIKIQVRNLAHSELIQNMLFAAGCAWRSGGTRLQPIDEEYMSVDSGVMTLFDDRESYNEDRNQEVDFDWLLPLTRKLAIDGKDTWLTRDKYNELRAQLGVSPIEQYPRAKIEVKNPKQSEMIQNMLFAAGCAWGYSSGVINTEGVALYLEPGGTLAFGISKTWFRDSSCQEVDFSWLLDTPDHKITIDGKDIILSEESFNNLKEQLGG